MPEHILCVRTGAYMCELIWEEYGFNRNAELRPSGYLKDCY